MTTTRKWRLVRLCVAGVLCLHALFVISLGERIARGYPDFSVFYTAARILNQGLGHQLYVADVQNRVQKEFTGNLPSRPAALPYIHPPFEALIFLPLSRLAYLPAFLTWDLLNIGILFGAALLLRPSIGLLRVMSPWESVLVAAAFFPVFECLLQGQDSILQLLACVLAWKALRKEEDFLAGCWFALGAFKFQLMLPIVLLVAIWRRSRILLGFAAVSAVLAAISIALVGWQGLLRYPAFALRVADTPNLGGVPADFLPNLHGLFMGWPLRLSGMIGTVVILLSSAALFLFFAMRGQRLAGPDKSGLQFSIAVAVSELIGWQTNIHDYTLLVLPMLLIADHGWHTPPRNAVGRWALLYPLFPLLISPVWFVLWLVTGNVNLIAVLLLWWLWKLSLEISGRQEVRV
jgi:hypothetical protein